MLSSAADAEVACGSTDARCREEVLVDEEVVGESDVIGRIKRITLSILIIGNSAPPFGFFCCPTR
jgi:hypothetical protein